MVNLLYTSLSNETLFNFMTIKGAIIVQESIINTTKTGPIHLPKDGRSVEVDVRNLVKTFGKHEAVKAVSFTLARAKSSGCLAPTVQAKAPPSI